MKKGARRDGPRTEEEEDRAFDELCFEINRPQAVLATREYEHTSDPRFAWLAYKIWREMQKAPNHAQFGVDDRLPQSLVQYLDTVADNITALRGGDLGRSLIAALGFKQGSKGKTGRWSGWAAKLNRDAELAVEMHRLINGEFKGKTDAAAREVSDRRFRQYREYRNRAWKHLEALPGAERRRALERLPEDSPLRRAKTLKDLRTEIDRQIAAYKTTLPSPSTVRRAYRRVFRKSAIS